MHAGSAALSRCSALRGRYSYSLAKAVFAFKRGIGQGRASLNPPTERTRRALPAAQAEKNENKLLGGAGKVADGVTDLIKPKFVPRPLAKLFLLFYGVGFVFALFQKLLSVSFFLAALGGGAYLLLKLVGGSGDSDNT